MSINFNLSTSARPYSFEQKINAIFLKCKEKIMEKQFELEPFIGLGLVNFGMSVKEVSTILGKPYEQEDDDIMEEIRENRKNVEFIYTYDDKKLLGELTFYKGSSLYFNGMDLMNTSGILEIMQKKYPDFEDIKGHCNFSKLGLLLCGFGKRKMPEGKYIMVYGKTRRSFFEGYGAA
jgi:hypothetical protein